MGRKSNVNPDHYTQAGRERQGEDVIHELHKRTYTQARQDPKLWHPGQAAVPVKAPRENSESKTRVSDIKGKDGQLTEARLAEENRETQRDMARDKTNEQLSGKRGARSTAQKRASARYDFEPVPAAKPVSGAFGNRGTKPVQSNASPVSGTEPSSSKKPAGSAKRASKTEKKRAR